MKKVLSVLLAFTIIFSYVATVSFAQGESQGDGGILTVESKTVEVSSQPMEFSLKVNVSNNPGFISALFKIGYDCDNIKLKGVRTGTVGKNMTLASKTISETSPAENPYAVSLENDTALTDVTLNGTLVILDFVLKANAPLGTYTVTVQCENDGFVNSQLQYVSFQTVDATVTVEEEKTKLFVDSATVETMGEAKEFSLNVNVSANPGFISAIFNVEFDTNNLILKSVRLGEIGQSLKNASMEISETNPAESPYVISLEGDTLTSDITANGTIAILDFTLKENAELADYTVSVSCAPSGFINNNLEFIDFTLIGGTVTVQKPQFIYGDANNDGFIDVKDVIRLRKYFANYDYETKTSTYEVGYGADANGDGTLDIKDLIRLRRYLANYDYTTNTSTVILGKAE